MSDNQFTNTVEHNANTFGETVQKTFAPMVDAVKNVGSKIDVPPAARDFVKRSAEMAGERAADIHAGTVRATDAMENAASKTVSNFAQLSRDVQAAAFDDAKAYLASVSRIAEAKTFGEAMQVQMDFLRDRSEVNMGRAKPMFDYVRGSLAEAGKRAQDTATNVVNAAKSA